MVASLPARVAAVADAAAGNRPRQNERFLPTLEQTTVTSTIVHGDFAPWNLRTHRGRISAFDWEYGELDGLPLMDEAHFTLQLGFQMQNWTPQQAREALPSIAAARPLELNVEQVNAIHAIYLLDQIVRCWAKGTMSGTTWSRGTDRFWRRSTRSREREAVMA
jgi:hypothetical protein